MRVIVIGAGVVGSAVAMGLTRRGAQVTVLDADGPGSGTSATTLAWVNSAKKEPEPYFQLNQAGVRAHHELAGQAASWFCPTGHLEWAVTDGHRAELAARIDTLAARDYPARTVTRREAETLEPDLATHRPASEYAFFPEEGYALPALLVARLLGEATDRGATVITGTTVTGLDPRPGSARVQTATGEWRTADVVVSCTGRWSAEVAALAGISVPMRDASQADRVTCGFVATTEPVPVRLSRLVSTDRLKVRPDGGGRLMLRAQDLDDLADPSTPPTLDDEVTRQFEARIPELLATARNPRVNKIAVGQRAMPADGMTIAGFAEPHCRFYVLVTHSGITLGPLLGELVAAEIHGERSPLLDNFRLDRFADTRLRVALQPARGPAEE